MKKRKCIEGTLRKNNLATQSLLSKNVFLQKATLPTENLGEGGFGEFCKCCRMSFIVGVYRGIHTYKRVNDRAKFDKFLISGYNEKGR